jgi:hypothetical protein
VCGEGVEGGEGWVGEDLDAFALGYEEVARGVGVREGGLVGADLLRVPGEDVGGAKGGDGDEDVGLEGGLVEEWYGSAVWVPSCRP